MAHTHPRAMAAPVATVVALAVGATACSSSTSPTSSTHAASVSGAKPASGWTVELAGNSSYGRILVDRAGKALYTYGPDKGHGGRSTCTGPCLADWPALTVAAGTSPSSAPDVSGTVGEVQQADGRCQVTYDGMPLYTFVQDSSAGQATGNGLEGFTVVTLTARTSGGPRTTTSTPAGSGYGY